MGKSKSKSGESKSGKGSKGSKKKKKCCSKKCRMVKVGESCGIEDGQEICKSFKCVRRCSNVCKMQWKCDSNASDFEDSYYGANEKEDLSKKCRNIDDDGEEYEVYEYDEVSEDTPLAQQ